MEKMAAFLKLYFPVFLLGSLFGKLVEISDFSAAVVSRVARFADGPWLMPTIVLTSALLTYGGVSLFVVVFAVYPFAARMFKRSNIPKRLMPATIALGAFTFTMDSLPGTPQIQNIIPTSFFGTTTWAAPWLGVTGSILFFARGCCIWNTNDGKRVRPEKDMGQDTRTSRRRKRPVRCRTR